MSFLKKLPTTITTGLGLTLIERAVKGSFARRCTEEELERVRAHFTHDGEIRCTYCDAPNPNRWAHIHPVSRGGDTVPGNIVPACGRCDDAKQDRDIGAWAVSTSPHRPTMERAAEILERIERYRAVFHYEPVEFVNKLTAEQWAMYEAISADIHALRKRLQDAGFAKPDPFAAR